MKKAIYTLILLIVLTANSSACPFCNTEIMDGIYNSQFYPNLFAMSSAFFVLALIVFVLSIMSTRRHRSRLAADPHVFIPSPVPLTTASIVLGIGIGGLIDGIVLHQILQQHEMLSNVVPSTEYIGKSVNMFWDGIFHFFCMLVVLTGMFLMWKLLFRETIDRSGKLLGGGLLLGWGLFNVVEGIINHHILELHNVIELSPDHDVANFAFLGISAVKIIVGFAIVNYRQSSRSSFR